MIKGLVFDSLYFEIYLEFEVCNLGFKKFYLRK